MSGPPTICKCGLAKSYHDGRLELRLPAHEYEPRYEPNAWREGYRRGLAEAAAPFEPAPLDVLRREVEAVCDAYGDKGWAKSAMVRRLREALARSEPVSASSAPTPAEPLDVLRDGLRDALTKYAKDCEQEWPNDPQIAEGVRLARSEAYRYLLAAARPGTPASAEQPGLREALEEATDRLEHVWDRMTPDIWTDDAPKRVLGGQVEEVVQGVYFALERMRAALAASPPEPEGK